MAVDGGATGKNWSGKAMHNDVGDVDRRGKSLAVEGQVLLLLFSYRGVPRTFKKPEHADAEHAKAV